MQEKGEPTINPAYVDAIEVAGEVGMDMALNSNAILFNEADVMRFLPHLSWLRISFQSADRSLYAKIHETKEKDFDKAVENIKLVCDIKKKLNLDVAIGVQQVLLKENGHDSYNIAKLARELGADYYVIKPCHPHEDNKFDYETEVDLVEKFRMF